MSKRALLAALYVLAFSGILHCDPVTDWNTAMLNAIRIPGTPPPTAARNLAILHISIYDAVNGIQRTHENYFVTGNVPSSASCEAAAAAAAHVVLMTVYPALQPQWDSEFESALQHIPDGPQKRTGIAWGEHVALAILNLRKNDGSAASVVFTGGTNPGEWRPTISFGGIVRPALLPQWGSVSPFGIPSPSAFMPPAPPKLESPQYAADVNQVKAFGS